MKAIEKQELSCPQNKFGLIKKHSSWNLVKSYQFQGLRVEKSITILLTFKMTFSIIWFDNTTKLSKRIRITEIASEFS